ncbi:serine hydrolase domain-containing protein [Candidatus Uabimicrobium sp. HlEnr_7]|uniref:serine hydrolase domain-containing protein n=1 Tax=Candidatus Uabimicrobium helgolandensis TaxID=3095367 RepID=UPI0035587AE4
MFIRQICIFITIIFLINCQAQMRSFDKTIPIDNTFSKNIYPTSAQLQNYQLAAKFSKKRAGKALIVIQGYNIVFEEYQNGHAAEVPLHIWSGTKGFTGAMGMCAVNDGIISIDEKIADTISEFKNDSLKAKITVRHLMNFTSGLKNNFGLTKDMMKEKQTIKDIYKAAIELPAIYEPGSRFVYGGVHHLVLGAFLRKKLQQNPLAYMEKKIFTPIGFRYSGWYKDSQGNPALPFGCWTTAREWAKFGILMRDDGKWKNKQVIPKGILKQCTIPTPVMPVFGFGFWLNREVPAKYRKHLGFFFRMRTNALFGPAIYPRGSKDIFVAAGHLGNRCYVIPSKNLVIVRLGSKNHQDFDTKFLKRILDGRIF